MVFEWSLLVGKLGLDKQLRRASRKKPMMEKNNSGFEFPIDLERNGFKIPLAYSVALLGLVKTLVLQKLFLRSGELKKGDRDG